MLQQFLVKIVISSAVFFFLCVQFSQIPQPFIKVLFGPFESSAGFFSKPVSLCVSFKIVSLFRVSPRAILGISISKPVVNP